jgi:hypothetical protein
MAKVVLHSIAVKMRSSLHNLLDLLPFDEAKMCGSTKMVDGTVRADSRMEATRAYELFRKV